MHQKEQLKSTANSSQQISKYSTFNLNTLNWTELHRHILVSLSLQETFQRIKRTELPVNCRSFNRNPTRHLRWPVSTSAHDEVAEMCNKRRVSLRLESSDENYWCKFFSFLEIRLKRQKMFDLHVMHLGNSYTSRSKWTFLQCSCNPVRVGPATPLELCYVWGVF